MYTLPLMGIAAHGSNTGKTQLILALLEEFTKRGLKAAVLKHGRHIDWQQEKDSGLFMRHGAAASLLITPAGFQLLNVPHSEPPFALALNTLWQSGRPDITLVEGYKREDHPKLLLAQESLTKEQLLPRTVAIISEKRQHGPLPCFKHRETETIADFIMRYCGTAFL